MDKLLDWAITIFSILAMVAIVFFVYNSIKNAIAESQNENTETRITEEDYYNDVDARYNSEDEDYYEDDGEDLYVEEEARIADEYGDNDAIADIMDEIISGETEEELLREELEQQAEANAEAKAKVDESVTKEKNTPDKTTVNEEPKPKPTTPKPAVTARNAKYLVIAGSFGSKKNADSFVKTLKKKGYQAEVVNFINSQMHTVVAARYNSKSKAEATKQEMKNKKIDCYVYTKK